MSDKTEDPTARRLRKAREEGDSGVSSYAAQSVAFVVAVALAPSAVRALASRAAGDLRFALTRAAEEAPSPQFDALGLTLTVTGLVIPLLLCTAIAGSVAHAVQTGGVIATKRLAPRLDRLNPAAGMKALVSSARLFAVARALVAGAVVGWLAYQGARSHVADFAHVAARTRWIAPLLSEVAGGLAWNAAFVGLALGLVDLTMTRRAWRGRLKMSKDEVKREYKDAEGDPQIKAARERAYRELVAQATISGVRSASVVVVNPTHLACALRYAPEGEADRDASPVVVASGEGDLAARIVKAARDWGIPVVRDIPLARALAELEVGDAIPEALYEAVAEILRDVWESERPGGA